MHKQLFTYATALLAITIVTACSSSDSTKNADTNNSANPDNVTGNSDTVNTEELAVAVPYIGTWNAGCNAFQFIGEEEPTYFMYSITIDETEWQLTIDSYFDENCSVQQIITDEGSMRTSTIVYTAMYTDEGIITTPEGLDANSLESITISVTNSIDGPDTPAQPLSGEPAELLVYVNDADILYLDSGRFPASNSDGGSLALTVPFVRAQ